MFHKGGEEQPLRNNKGRTTRFAKAKKQAKRDTETELQKLTVSTSKFSSMRTSWKKDSSSVKTGQRQSMATGTYVSSSSSFDVLWKGGGSWLVS